MANWSTLKAAIADIIKTNGNKEITGQLLQNTLNNIVSSVGENSTFAGIATPATNPGVPDGNVFYLATEEGIYSNFNGIEITSGEAVILEWRGSWEKKTSGFATQQKLNEALSNISNISSSTTLNNRLKELYIDKSKYNFSSARVKYVAYQSSSDTYPISIELYQNTISGIQKRVERAIPSSEFENNKVLEIADGVYAVFNIDKSDYKTIPVTDLNSFVFNKPIKGLIAAYLYNKEYVRYVQTATYNQSLYNAAIKELLIWGKDVDLVHWIQYNKEGNSLVLIDASSSFNVLARMEYREGEYISKIIPNKANVFGLVIFDWDILTDADQYQTFLLNKDIAKDVESKVNLKQLYYAIKDDLKEYLSINSIKLNTGQILNLPILQNIVQSNTYYKLSIEGDESQISEFHINCTKKEGGYGNIGILPINGSIVFSLDYEVTNILVQQTDITWNKTTTLTYKFSHATEEEILNKLSEKIASVPSPDKLYYTLIGDYRYQNIINVGKGKDFDTIQEAINSISDASINNQYLILVHDDIIVTDVTDLWLPNGNHATGYTTECALVWTKSFVNIMGAKRMVKISVRLPRGASNQEVYCHNFYAKGSVKIANLYIISENTRYCIHQENGSGSSSGSDANSNKEYRNLKLEYIAGNSHNTAFGVGTAPNMRVYMENVEMTSHVAMGMNKFHSHANYDYPFTWIMKNCKVNTQDSELIEFGYADIYSGVKQNITIEGCDIPMWGDFKQDYNFDYTLEDNCHDYRNGGHFLSGFGNCCVMGKEHADVLVFESIDNNKTISVTGGTAFDDIIGDCLISYSGSTDAKGIYAGCEFIYGTKMGLAKRLGNCSLQNKTLEITIDSEKEIVTLNEDYSSLDNSSIINKINTQLSKCKCHIGIDIKRLYFSDEVKYVKNTGTGTIKIGDCLSFDSSNNGVKLCQSGDRIYGVAAERINSGDFGFMVKRGKQKFLSTDSSIGGLKSSSNSKYYAAGDNGTLIETTEDKAEFIGTINDIIIWK